MCRRLSIFIRASSLRNRFLGHGRNWLCVAYHQEADENDFSEAGIEMREIHLLAKLENEVVGAITVKSSKQFRIGHIGNIFIAVKKNIGVMELVLYS